MARPNDINAEVYETVSQKVEELSEKSFPQMGFKPIKVSRSKRLVTLVYGLEGTGKTHFALTAPGPIAIFDFDNGLQDMVNKFTKKGKEIYRIAYKKPMGNYDDSGGEWMETLEDMRVKFLWAMGKARTVIVDTGGEMWETVRAAHNNGSLNSTQLMYTRPNAEMRWFMDSARSQNKCNVIIVEKAKKEYVDGDWTGDFEPAGWSHMPFEVQLCVYLEKDDDTHELTGRIMKCRPRKAMLGKEFTDTGKKMKLDFSHVAVQALRGTALEDWK